MRNVKSKEEAPEYRHPLTGEPADPVTGALEEGLFYERIFGPVEVEVRQDEEEGKKSRYMVLTDANGQQLVIRDPSAMGHIRDFFWLDRGNKLKKLTKASLKKQGMMLTKYAKAREEPLKFMYDAETGEYVSVASLKHKQIAWKAIRKLLNKAIVKAFGKTEVAKIPELANAWSHKMPVENDLVSMWVHVEAGNNKKQGRSAIRISTRVRTEFDRASGGVSAPCLNWAQLWYAPMQWFGLTRDRITSTGGQRLETQDGEPLVIPATMNRFDIHIQSTEFDANRLTQQLRNLREVAESVVIKEYVETSIAEPLTSREALDILEAYRDGSSRGVATLPAYIINTIIAKFNFDIDFTVWGFSNAISFVRTHGEIKGRKSRETKDLTWVLERLAGEILSIAPILKDFHAKAGPITYAKLLGHPRPATCPKCEATMIWELTEADSDSYYQERCPNHEHEPYLGRNVEYVKREGAYGREMPATTQTPGGD